MRVLTPFLFWNVGLAPAETQTSEAERACLARHAAGRRRLAEVGGWHGVTTAQPTTETRPRVTSSKSSWSAGLHEVDPGPQITTRDIYSLFISSATSR